jgi:hypothetical protein
MEFSGTTPPRTIEERRMNNVRSEKFDLSTCPIYRFQHLIPAFLDVSENVAAAAVDEVCPDGLNATVGMNKLDRDTFLIGFYLGGRHAAGDRAAFG